MLAQEQPAIARVAEKSCSAAKNGVMA